MPVAAETPMYLWFFAGPSHTSSQPGFFNINVHIFYIMGDFLPSLYRNSPRWTWKWVERGWHAPKSHRQELNQAFHKRLFTQGHALPNEPLRYLGCLDVHPRPPNPHYICAYINQTNKIMHLCDWKEAGSESTQSVSSVTVSQFSHVYLLKGTMCSHCTWLPQSK